MPLSFVFPIKDFNFDYAAPMGFYYFFNTISGLMTTSGLAPFLNNADRIEFLSFSKTGAYIVLNEKLAVESSSFFLKAGFMFRSEISITYMDYFSFRLNILLSIFYI